MEETTRTPVTLEEIKAAEERVASLRANAVEDLLSEARKLESKINEIYAKIREYGGSAPKGTKSGTVRSRAPNFTDEQKAEVLAKVQAFYEFQTTDGWFSPGKVTRDYPKNRVAEAIKQLVEAGKLEHNGEEKIKSAYRFKRSPAAVTKPIKRPAKK